MEIHSWTKNSFMASHSVIVLFALPPTITNDTKYSQGSKGKHNNASVQRLGRPFAQLLSRAGTDGALGLDYGRGDKEEAQDQQGQSVLLYQEILFFQLIHNCGVESQNYDY
jgi:hypothetical protein